MIKPNYWHTREQQRKAYRKQLIKAYAPLVFLIAVALVVVML
jgi:hypothetical protein